MSEWKENKIEDISIFIKDGTHGTHKDVANGIPLLSAKDIEKGKILIPDDCRTISEMDYNQIHANYEIENDDLLLTIVGTIGRVAIVKELARKITFQRSVGIIRFKKERISPNYSFYFFQSNEFQQTLERLKNASAQGGVYLGSLAKANIYHPISISEQCQIARILSTCDAVIEKTLAAIAKYKAIKQGMLHDLFTRGIDITTGKLRPKYEETPKLYKESELGWVPKDWEVKRINDCIDPIMSNVDKHIKEDEIKILLCNYMDVYTNRYLTKEISFSQGSVNSAEQQRFSLKPQDVIITKDSETPDDIAIPSVLIEKVENLICGYHLCILRSKDINKLNGEFLMLQLQMPEINKQFANKANGSTRYGLTIDSIECNFLKISNNINEQIEIVKRLRTIDNKLLAEQNYLQKLQMLKQGLMADLLTGRKKVKVDEKKITRN